MNRQTPKKSSRPTIKMPLLEKTAEVSFFKNRSKNTQRYYVDPTHPLYTQYTQSPKQIRGTITYQGFIHISEDRRAVQGIFPYEGPADGVKDAIIANINIKYEHVDYDDINWDEFDITITVQGTVRPLNYAQNAMRESKPFSIVNLFNNIINIDTAPNNCVPDTLTHLFPKIAKQKKNPIAKLKEATTEQVMEFCKEHGIRAIAYNIHKQVIAEHIPEIDNKKYATLVYLYYNNHMYLIKHKFLKEKPNSTKYEHQSEDNLQEHFRTLINQKIIPANIKLDGVNVTSFEHDDTTYFSNPDFDTVKSIGKQFMFSDKIPFYTSLTSLMKHLEPLYTSNFAMSFLPINHVKPAFFYNRRRDPSRPIISIDKNKAYSYILMNLPNLLSTDIRTHELQHTDKADDPNALYIAKPNIPNILMPKQDIYSGEHIEFCKNKFEFTITEKLKCKAHDNHFKFLVEDLYAKIDPDIVKKVIVRAIGQFQSEPKTNHDITVVNEDDRNPKHFPIPVEDVFLEQIPNTYISNLYNRKPIAIQVKDRMNRMLYEKMEELNLTNEDIVQINTDSITFYERPINFKPSKDLDGWKYSTYKDAQGSIYDTTKPFTTFQQYIPNQNTLIIGPAGNGKSYRIQHSNLTNSIILSSKHSAIRQHREKGLNAQVIQYYEFNQSIPTEDHIIIEECGILTRTHWDIIYKCVLLNKKLTVYGDFDQLLPVDEIHTFNRPTFLNQIFSTQEELNTNWRNDFSLDYYRSLQTGTKQYLKQQLLKYSTKTPEEADVIIAYRNIIVDKYNEHMLAYHNKTLEDADVPIQCITNDLRKKDIYNGFNFMSGDIEYADRTNPKLFRLAYCRTLYNLQGDETKSFYVAPEDMDWFLHPRVAYTLISRLKVQKH